MCSELSPGQWIDAVSLRLQKRWPTVDPEQLADVACDLLKVPQLRCLPPRTSGRGVVAARRARGAT